LGKIANALGKYAQERQAARLPKLTRADRVALISYNRKTGHLLNPDTATGKLGNHSMEELKNMGILQRLLVHKLIIPGGKLTPKGVAECERLIKLNQEREPAVDNDIKIKGKIIEDIDTDDVIIEMEEEVDPVEPSGAVESSTKKVVPLLKRPAAVKPGPAPQPEIEEASKIPPPAVEETVIERGKQETTTGKDKNLAAVPDIPDKMDDKKVENERFPDPVPGVSFDDKRLYKNLVSLVDPQSYEAEQFKMLRNNILFPVAGVAPQTILVTSSLPGEGKSFVSANLAVSIAMNINKHVLLIDCDLRKPDLHHVFGFGDVPGLSDHLAERRSLDSLLLKTTVEKLTLLPGGPIPPNPSELASSERMSAMLEEVKHRYQDRLIVIDSPPPGLAAETSFLARQVDGVLLVVKYGKTPKEDVEDLMVTVGSDKILGVVINYLDMPMSRRYGYGKYGRYGGYGQG
jgi:exopolysaccharide/PEP-CTERM locus tyrosine autokinase